MMAAKMMTTVLAMTAKMDSDKDTAMMLDNGLKRQQNFYGKD